MKTCHITSVHPRYDIRIFIKECQALSTEHEVSLIVADSLGNETKNGINIYDVGKAGGGRIQRMRQSSQAILEQILILQPKVVHFHDPELIGLGRKLIGLGYQVIYDVHEDVPKQVLNKPWIPRLLRPLVSYWIKQQERAAAKLFSGIICATEIIAKRFKSYNPNTIAIHNYPILAELAGNNTAWSSRSADICYIGSISATRGILPLVNSLAESNLRLELAGTFSDRVIEAQLKSDNNYAAVNYHGVLDRQGIANLLTQVRVGMVTLLPTPSYVESLPIKLFEYMLAGIPVVASDFPLWQPIVSGNNCGIMVDPSDSTSIARACRWLIDNPEAAQKMGENGKQAVLEHYIWERESLRLCEFYKLLEF